MANFSTLQQTVDELSQYMQDFGTKYLSTAINPKTIRNRYVNIKGMIFPLI